MQKYLSFLFSHRVGSVRLKAFKSHYLENGLVPRMQGNTGHVPHNTLSLEDVQHIVQFILHYAEVNAVLLPGCIPGYNRDVQLLPCSTTKRSVGLVYKEATRELLPKTATYSTFLKLWQHLPNTIVARSMTDL